MKEQAQRTIHSKELPPAAPGSPIATEWETYRREVGRLLEEGHEGEVVLIKGEQIIGFYPDNTTAYEEGVKRYLLEPFLIQPVRVEEPLLHKLGTLREFIFRRSDGIGQIQRTINYNNLPPAEPGSILATEWELYRREVARLLEQGYEGKAVLIKGEQIIGIYPNFDDAEEEGAKRYSPDAYLVQEILAETPTMRTRC